MDGWITIGTELDTKELQKQLKDAEKELKKFEKEEEKLLDKKAKIEVDISEYEKEIAKVKQMTSEDLKLAVTDEQAEQVLQMEETQINQINEKYKSQFEKLEKINGKLQENTNNISLSKEKVSQLNEEIKKSKGFDKIKDSIGEVGKSMDKTVKKVAKWAIAVFGIRSAYMFVRNAINTIAGDDDQLKADIDYMKNALAYSIEPLVRGIVDLAKTLMFYLAYIIKQWTGKNIFENANKSLKKSNKQAKELKKTLTGFDEINLLSGNSSSGGAATPSFNLENLENMPVPAWLEWIVNNKDIVIATLLGIAGGITAIKLGIDLLSATTIVAIIIQLVLILQGLWTQIKNIIAFIKEPTWDNFFKLIEGFPNTLGIVGRAINWVIDTFLGGWDNVKKTVEGIPNFVDTYMIQPVGNLFKGLWQGIVDGWNGLVNVIKEIPNWVKNNIINPIGNFFTGLWNGLKNGVLGASNFIKDIFSGIVTFFKNLISKIVSTFKDLGVRVGDAVGGAFKQVINGVLNAIESILNTPIRAINRLIDTINEIPGVYIGRLNTINLPRLAKGGIVNFPGRGVPVGGAIAGEAGREGVIPLTDTAQMELIGEEIGKHVTINLTNITQLDSRELSRKVQKVSAERNFAFER